MLRDDLTRLRHMLDAYFDLNVDILWETVTRDLPPLVHQLEQILEQETQA